MEEPFNARPLEDFGWDDLVVLDHEVHLPSVAEAAGQTLDLAAEAAAVLVGAEPSRSTTPNTEPAIRRPSGPRRRW